jgi:MOSC domain-containing protein YiiM
VTAFVMAIATKSKSKAPMELHDEATVTTVDGIVGDRLGRGGKDRNRQVTLLSDELWAETCAGLGASLPWTARRANVLIRGVDFDAVSIGTKLRFGTDVILQVTGVTLPCKRMDEAYPGLQGELHGRRGGLTCRVVRGGTLRIGDGLSLVP